MIDTNLFFAILFLKVYKVQNIYMCKKNEYKDFDI